MFIVVAIAAIGLILGLGIRGSGDDPDEPDDFTASDASGIAASLSHDYSGFFGDDLYLAKGETNAEATDFYPNGSSRGSTENYVTFKVLKDSAAAKSQFGTIRASYASQIGTTVMSSEIHGTYARGALDGAIGYYNNLASSSYIYYAGYYGNVLFESYFLLHGKAIGDAEVSNFADAIHSAIVNPVDVSLAKRYYPPIPEPADDVTCRLLVYGNANQDNYLDQADLELIQKIAAGTWDSAKYPYADANNDGRVDSADVEVVKRFLNGQSATMYYTDWNLGVSSIQYPLSGRIAGTYDSSLWFAQIVGVYDDVKYLCRTQAYIDALREDMFPGAAKNIVAQGSNGNFDPEKLIANNIKVVIGDPFGISAEYLEKVSRFKSIQTILLPENREINGLNWSNSVVTLGVMFNKQDNTREYVEYIEKVEKKIEDAVAKATADEKDLTYLLIYAQPGSTGVGLDVRSTGTTQYGDVANVENLPLTCVVRNSSSNWVDSSVEDVLAMDPDVIIFTAWGPFQNNYTQQQYAEFINGMLQDYKTSSAYKSGQVYSISYEVYGTLPGISGIPYLGSQIWPNLFDEDEGVALLQEYFDKFTYISGRDVRTVPTLLPLTLAEIESVQEPEYVENDKTGISVSFKYDPSIRLAIFGNANGDDYLDGNDLTVLRDIVSGKRAYDPVSNAFADTDGNGYINNSDVALLKKLVNKEECKLYYWDNKYEVNSIDYPLKGKIAVHHVYPLDACIILDLYDDVVGMTNQGFQNAIGKDTSRYPGSGTTIKNIGVPEEDPEALLTTGAEVFIAPAASKDYSKVVDAYKSAKMNIQIVRLCMSQYYTTCADLYGSILMLGVMFQKENEAQEFVAFADELLKYVNDSKLNLSEYTFITPYDITETSMELDSSLVNGNAMGDVYTISKLPMRSVNVVTESSYCPEVTMEKVLEINPEVIVIITFHTYAWSVEQHQEEVNTLAEYFKGTSAYKNGKIYSVNYYNIANYGGIPQLALLASYIWPDSFSESVGWEYLDKYYNTWTKYPDPDVKNMGNAIPYKWEKP
jgi:ABC-type Fe3+-hydroxamate transport system substrate-binding protein